MPIFRLPMPSLLLPLLIVGAGGHGRVVFDLARQAGWTVAGFLDADARLHGTTVLGAPVLGAPTPAARWRDFAPHVALGVGDNRARAAYAAEFARAGFELPPLVHPHATVAPTATLGPGTVVGAGARVCVDARLAGACVVNTNAVVDHECELAEAVHVAPGALLAGRVTCGARAFVGLGAKVLQCLTLGPDATVGAGAVVLRDVDAGSTVVGVPAKKLGPALVMPRVARAG